MQNFSELCNTFFKKLKHEHKTSLNFTTLDTTIQHCHNICKLYKTLQHLYTTLHNFTKLCYNYTQLYTHENSTQHSNTIPHNFTQLYPNIKKKQFYKLYKIIRNFTQLHKSSHKTNTYTELSNKTAHTNTLQYFTPLYTPV